jgi:hypothetical protein
LSERFEHGPECTHNPPGLRWRLVSDQFSCLLLSPGARVRPYDFGLVFGHLLTSRLAHQKFGSDSRATANERAARFEWLDPFAKARH